VILIRVLCKCNRENLPPFEMMCRNNEIEELKTKLNNQQSNQVAVIYVVGHSGMGKRTFLSSAYENKDIRDHFGACISVRFPPNISEEEMVKQIKEQLLQGGCSLYNRRDPNDAPGSSVSFLVWIDSQISMRKWRSVEHNLSTTIVTGERDKIKIMVSATSRHMWMEERNSIIIKLEHLDKKESSELFDYILKLWMPRTSDHIKMGIEEVKRNIKEITSGLPLAMVTLAKFMIAMDNYNKWETASNYTINKINDDKLKVILLLSVDDLPDELKVCLLYTAGFPDDTVIDAKQLVRLWTAEGFLSPQHGMEAEQLGQCYLKELIYRGLLLNKTSSKEDGDVHSVAIHSLVHHILRLEGQRRSFMHVHCGGGVVTAPDNTRRLALWNNHNTSIKLGDRYGKLRAVLSFGNNNMETQANDDQGISCNQLRCRNSL
jgi:disease resistance protein RPM1